ncbi:chondroitin sulfate synthase 1-like [Ptychodera flava]|uniref:chondroitin sulfate synthase 1-like n=1 Tax=Ptychodera flava TaxID=63121 RepID=UPI00396A955D
MVCRRRYGFTDYLKFLTFSMLGFSARTLLDVLDPDSACPKCPACPVSPRATSPGAEYVNRISEKDPETHGNNIHEDFKPRTMYEVLRWAYFTEKHLYENLDDDPRIGLIGNYKHDVNDILSEALLMINSYGSPQYTFEKLTNGYRQVDSLKGAEYILDLEVKNSNSGKIEERRVHLLRPFSEVFSPPRLSGNKSNRVNFILTVSGISDRFEAFMQRYEEVCLKTDENTSLLVVLFDGATGAEEDNANEVKSIMQSYQQSYPNALITYIQSKGSFSRAVGLDLGIKQYPTDALLFISDVDVDFDAGFLDRCRLNTVQKHQVYFPIVFSLYDPAYIYQDLEEDKRPETPSMDINKHNGFWIHYGYGMVCMYYEEYRTVGGFNVKIRGWGGEDVDLYKRFIRHPHIKVFRAVDPALVHHYHEKSCDPELSADQYRMCVGSLSESIGSKSQLAKKILGLTRHGN